MYGNAAIAQIERVIAPPQVVEADDLSRRQRRVY
jgi:hypothetical protein